jgi:dolichol kinase
MSNTTNYEISRAVFHIGASLILVWILDYVKPVIATSVIFAIVLLIELIRLKHAKINHLIVNHRKSFLKKIIRYEEIFDFSPLLVVSLAFLLISWLPLNLLKTAIWVNAFADPTARIFGVKWGRKKILNTKNSWVGSSAFFIVAFLVSAYYVNILPALAAAATGTIAEFIPDKKPFWVDNLRIPVFVGLVLYFVA